MTNLADFDKTVSDFMDDFGSTAILHIASGTPIRDLETGDTTIPIVPYTVRAILLDLTLQSNGLTTVNGTLISSADKLAFVQPLEKSSGIPMPPINPNKDKFEMGGRLYSIITLKEMNPSTDNKVLYELYLKR